MPAHRDFRDPVHGFIRLERHECEIVDTPIFQRLRRIRQLAMAYLVYPGAVHTRFEHTLGVTDVAGRLCERLAIDPSHARLIRLAALLHDLGHGPFSHVSESVLEELSSPLGEMDKIHEVITRRVIRSDAALNKCIAENEREEVIRLLDDGQGVDQPIYRSVVSGPVDADKQDYFLRDSYYCGVEYGRYDIKRLHAVLGRGRTPAGDMIFVDEDGVNTLEQFVLARYYVTTQIVRHRIRRIADAMLVRAIMLGVRVDKLSPLQELYSFSDTSTFADQYMTWNDERLVTVLLERQHDGTWAGRLMRRLAERRLFKRLVNIELEEIDPALTMNPEHIKGVQPVLEAEIAEKLSTLQGVSVDSNEVIIEIITAPPAKKSEGPVLIRSSRGETTFERQSAIFRSIDKTLNEPRLVCYVPLAVLDESKRRVIEEKLEEFVKLKTKALLTEADLTGVSKEDVA